MNFYDLDAEMRRFEIFHGTKIPPRNWGIIRVDGRGFHTVLKRYEKPFSEQVRDAMNESARQLITKMDGIYVYTQSDEISLLLRRDTDEFARSHEKLVSIAASIAAVAFARTEGFDVQFDARLIACPSEETVVDYFRWRQADAAKNALSSWAYWTLRKNGKGPVAATQQLSGFTQAQKHDLLWSYGINYNTVPEWQKRGIAWRYKTQVKLCHRPEGPTLATRRWLVSEMALPINDEYGRMIYEVLATDRMVPVAASAASGNADPALAQG